VALMVQKQGGGVASGFWSTPSKPSRKRSQ
jgi:hypothetical protein